MTLELFNTSIGIISLLLAIFATSKVYKLQNQIKSSNQSGNNSPITNSVQNVKGKNNTTSGRDIKL
jgi:hypothetical protein